ncbi:hypothetical protein [uncultured Propionibacterium sp.]|uniref:hypothetical protein n=1 Tax=uncultured Propionibacterium sp. TaxID=218066 RepID=UPI00292EE625|nr:hypothetical protein [uncultured Propionibacterium sp.]
MGGHHFYGHAPLADKAREMDLVPIGLLEHSKPKTDKGVDEMITYDGIEIDRTRPLVAMRFLQDSMAARGVLG